MPINDIYGREKYDFTSKIVDIRDKEVTLQEMLAQGWKFDFEEYDKVINSNAGVLLTFYKEKNRSS